MVKLGDLLDITWSVTLLDVRAYSNYELQHNWVIGENPDLTTFQRREMEAGTLTAIQRNINYHGTFYHGRYESGCGVDKTKIPKELLDGQATHMLLPNLFRGGHELVVSVEMPKLVAQMLKDELRQAEDVIKEEDYEAE